MNNIRSIVLSTIFITAAIVMSMDLCCEIQKIPNLLEHYAEHKATDGDSFWQFLVEDYIDHGSGENDHNDKDHDDLPFHGNHQCQHSTVLYTTNLAFPIGIEARQIEVSECKYQFSFASPYLENPFQPPQA
ncbi:MAG: hypothetical protein ABJG41_18650 [Cyclobacteriaceae bacterium]